MKSSGNCDRLIGYSFPSIDILINSANSYALSRGYKSFNTQYP